MPPVIDADSILSSSDSILLQAIDSLAGKKDSLLMARESMDEESIAIMEDENNEIPEEEEENLEPLYLTRAQQRDRNACLLYADTIQANMQRFLESLEAENAYYQSVRDKVRELDEYAQSRYKLLQDNIFRNGGSNYFSILASLPMQIMMQAGLSGCSMPASWQWQCSAECRICRGYGRGSERKARNARKKVDSVFREGRG